uniref:Uncharacterized protein n=1 Tax=Oryza punctata TaxID=4537 RepID=A0A0E0MD93_ORYPU
MALELQLATRSKKSLAVGVVVVAVPLLMCLLVAVAAASAAAASSGQYRPSYGDAYATCIPVAACDDDGCATRCRDMGYNPVGSACWTSKDIKLYCCCGHNYDCMLVRSLLGGDMCQVDNILQEMLHDAEQTSYSERDYEKIPPGFGCRLRDSSLATLSSKPSPVAAVPLLMCLLVATAVAASSSAASLERSDADAYSMCFEAGGCSNTGCAIRCRDMGHNPAGSACRTKDTTLYCCCGVGQDTPPSLAAHSRKSAVVVLMPLLMLLLAAMAVSAAISYQPNDQMSDFGMCFFARSCDGTGCAIRCRDLGWNPAGSGCRKYPNIDLLCCCAKPSSSSSSSPTPSIA